MTTGRINQVTVVSRAGAAVRWEARRYTRKVRQLAFEKQLGHSIFVLAHYWGTTLTGCVPRSCHNVGRRRRRSAAGAKVG